MLRHSGGRRGTAERSHAPPTRTRLTSALPTTSPTSTTLEGARPKLSAREQRWEWSGTREQAERLEAAQAHKHMVWKMEHARRAEQLAGATSRSWLLWEALHPILLGVLVVGALPSALALVGSGGSGQQAQTQRERAAGRGEGQRAQRGAAKTHCVSCSFQLTKAFDPSEV